MYLSARRQSGIGPLRLLLLPQLFSSEMIPDSHCNSLQRSMGAANPACLLTENFCHLIGKKTQPFIGKCMSTRLASSPPWPQFIVSQFLEEVAATLLFRGLLQSAGQG
jgi:hypothetical protein